MLKCSLFSLLFSLLPLSLSPLSSFFLSLSLSLYFTLFLSFTHPPSLLLSLFSSQLLRLAPTIGTIVYFSRKMGSMGGSGKGVSQHSCKPVSFASQCVSPELCPNVSLLVDHLGSRLPDTKQHCKEEKK